MEVALFSNVEETRTEVPSGYMVVIPEKLLLSCQTHLI